MKLVERLRIDDLKQLENQLDKLLKLWQQLQNKHVKLQTHYAQLQQEHEKQLATHSTLIAKEIQAREESIDALNEEWRVRYQNDTRALQEELSTVKVQYEQALNELKATHQSEIDALNNLLDVEKRDKAAMFARIRGETV